MSVFCWNPESDFTKVYSYTQPLPAKPCRRAGLSSGNTPRAEAARTAAIPHGSGVRAVTIVAGTQSGRGTPPVRISTPPYNKDLFYARARSTAARQRRTEGTLKMSWSFSVRLVDEEGNPYPNEEVTCFFGFMHHEEVETTDGDGWAYFTHEHDEDGKMHVASLYVGGIWGQNKYVLLSGEDIPDEDEKSFTIPREDEEND